MLDVKNISMQYGPKSLFQDVDLILLPTQRYGVVGANGTGKSTFLKILAGEEQASYGSVDKAKNHKIGILKQDHFRYEQDRLVDVVIRGNAVLWDALTEKENLYSKETFTEEDGYRLSALEEIVMNQGGLDEHRGWSEFLVNLTLAILGGVGLLVKGVINIASNRNFFFVHQTESSEILDQLKEDIKNLNPLGG